MVMDMTNVSGVAVLAASLFAARQFYRDWGTTKEECHLTLPGDQLVREPAVQRTEAIWIDAPASAIWPWLTQMGQDRGGFYSYEKLGNFAGLRIHNADSIHGAWQHLAAGDEVRLAPRGIGGLPGGLTLPVAEVIPDQAIVLGGSGQRLPWAAVWSFHIVPQWQDRCRLLVRTRMPMRHPGEVIGAELAGPLLALMTRGMLLGIKRRAECESVEDPAIPPLDRCR